MRVSLSCGVKNKKHETSRILRKSVLLAELASQAGLQRAASPLPGLQGQASLGGLYSPASSLSCAPPVAARKREKKSFSGTPRTPAGTLRSLHPRFLARLTEKFGMTRVYLD